MFKTIAIMLKKSILRRRSKLKKYTECKNSSFEVNNLIRKQQIYALSIDLRSKMSLKIVELINYVLRGLILKP